MTAESRVPTTMRTSRPKTSCSAAETPPGHVVGDTVCPVMGLTGKPVSVDAPWQAMRNPTTIRYSDRPMGGSDLRSGMRLHHFRLGPPENRRMSGSPPNGLMADGGNRRAGGGKVLVQRSEAQR